MLGTPAYMSPEQCRGAGEVDSRADLYSVGCVLYHLLSGDPPFRAKGSGSVLEAHIYESPVPLRSVISKVDADVERLAMGLLEKDPAKRPQTAADVLDAIRSIRNSGEFSLPSSSLAFEPTDLATRAAPEETGVEYTAPPRSIGTAETVASAPNALREDERTTLSSATATSQTASLPETSRRGLALALGGATVVAIAAGSAIYVAGGSGSDKSDAAPIAVTAPTLAEDAQPVLAPDAAPVSSEVKISVDSSPSGADVFLHFDGRSYFGSRGKALGKTPLQISLQPFDGEFAFRLDRSRYHEVELRLPGNVDSDELVELKRVTKGQRKKRTQPTPATSARPPSDKDPTPDPSTTERAPIDGDSVVNPYDKRPRP